ncbi:MAG: hypothetical protein IPK83_18270 [Planctomycetes bacterium]|nr:hypothetical protein [Planctomycetota bacterium]
MSERPRVLYVVAIGTMLAIGSCGPKESTSGAADRRQDAGAASQWKTAHRTPADDAMNPSSTSSPEANPNGQVIEYQPGIRIDYRGLQIEVDAEVILRTGELELFAYCKSPTPKEHETILRTSVKAEHIYQALGLIGLKPGNPVMYDWETSKVTPASGDAVDVLVRYEEGGETIERNVCEWMYDLERDAVMAPKHWLFTGSRRDEKGRFAADVEGTLVTVVNFDTAVLSLPESHSDSDGELWVAARTEVIPEVGTKLTLILRPAK